MKKDYRFIILASGITIIVGLVWGSSVEQTLMLFIGFCIIGYLDEIVNELKKK